MNRFFKDQSPAGLTGISIVLDRALTNLSKTGRTRKQFISMLLDAACCSLALWLAYTLRLDTFFTQFADSWYLFLALSVLTIGVFLGFGIYRWEVRSSNRVLTLQIMKASIVSATILMILLFLFPPLEANPRSLFAIYGLLFFTNVSAYRFIWQWVQGVDAGSDVGEPVAIYGAGSAGIQLARLMSLSPDFKPALFIDDNRSLKRTTIQGLRVYDGGGANLHAILKKYEISRIVLALPSAKGKVYADILDRLSQYEIPVQTIPSISEIVEGGKSPDEIRDISIADILGRTQVAPDPNLIRKRVEGKVVLVTGGGGSIGSEICRQALRLSVSKLIVLEQSESNLYAISEEINRELQKSDMANTGQTERITYVPILGSVLDAKKVSAIFREHKVDTVYHAAAYKHVPIVEKFPEEGIRVNIFGTRSVLETAIKHNTGTFVLISTDKAVRPTNAMGATKRVAELVLQAAAQIDTDTQICMVRFGNVLGSSGSVVPKFSQQINRGGPVTITHPEITRYFMTIPEASQLVLQASSLANGGEVFVLDMGKPIRIRDLAIKMIKLHGKHVATDEDSTGIRLAVTGLRPGEKLHEELFISGKETETGVSKILREEYLPLDPDMVSRSLDQLQQLLDNEDYGTARDLVIDLALKSADNLADNPADTYADEVPTVA